MARAVSMLRSVLLNAYALCHPSTRLLCAVCDIFHITCGVSPPRIGFWVLAYGFTSYLCLADPNGTTDTFHMASRGFNSNITGDLRSTTVLPIAFDLRFNSS